MRHSFMVSTLDPLDNNNHDVKMIKQIWSTEGMSVHLWMSYGNFLQVIPFSLFKDFESISDSDEDLPDAINGTKSLVPDVRTIMLIILR